jgi:hypothetical protein
LAAFAKRGLKAQQCARIEKCRFRNLYLGPIAMNGSKVLNIEWVHQHEPGRHPDLNSRPPKRHLGPIEGWIIERWSRPFVTFWGPPHKDPSVPNLYGVGHRARTSPVGFSPVWQERIAMKRAAKQAGRVDAGES